MAVGQTRFMFCPGFFGFVGDQTQTSTWPNHDQDFESCNLMMFLFLQSSIDKTAPNLQRRILKLMKNPQSQMTVKICTTECAHDEVCTEY